jgi:energy-coupling factor transporter ATP-binding protein EcfA2
MKLDVISIQGFRSIGELRDLKVGSPTLLAGHNDAGKSAILDAIRFLLNDYSLTERDPTFATLTSGETLDAGQLAPRVDLTATEGTFTLSVQEVSDLNTASEIRIRRTSRGGAPSTYEVMSLIPTNPLLRDYKDSLLADLKSRVENLQLNPEGQTKAALIAALDVEVGSTELVEEWIQAPSSLIRALPKVERFNPSGISDAEDAIRSALQIAYKGHSENIAFRENIHSLEHALEEQLKIDAEALRNHIRARCDDIGNVQILPSVSFTSGLKATQISVTTRDGEDVRLGEAGAGRARRVSLAVWEFNTGLLANAGDVVMLYDEPDTHLDYSHQRDFMRLVREQCALPNVRMVIATHSMNLIDGIDISDVVHVKHFEHRTVIDRLGDDSEIGKHLGAIAASLGLRNTVLLNERLFLGVEGDTEAAALPVLFRHATGRQLESCGIALWACRNNEGAMDFACFLVAHSRNVSFLVDADSKTNARHVFSNDKLIARGLRPNEHALYVGDPTEIEDIFSDEQWVDVANATWPPINTQPWEIAQIGECRGNGKKFSDELLTLFGVGSHIGPRRKPDMLMALALRMSKKESPEPLREVPEQLDDIFKELIKRAN